MCWWLIEIDQMAGELNKMTLSSFPEFYVNAQVMNQYWVVSFLQRSSHS